jgi:hypothetical protein
MLVKSGTLCCDTSARRPLRRSEQRRKILCRENEDE